MRRHVTAWTLPLTALITTTLPSHATACPSFALQGRDIRGIAYEASGLWVVHSLLGESDYVKLSKLDPNTGSIIHDSQVMHYNGRGLCIAHGSLWLVDAYLNAVRELDPIDFHQRSSFSTPASEPHGITSDGVHLWLTVPNRLYKLSTSGQVIDSFPISGYPELDWDWHIGGMWARTGPRQIGHYTDRGQLDLTYDITCLPPNSSIYGLAIGGSTLYLSQPHYIYLSSAPASPRITGSILDAFNQLPIRYATITVIDSHRPQQQYTAITGPDGHYAVSVPGGASTDYYLQAAHTPPDNLPAGYAAPPSQHIGTVVQPMQLDPLLLTTKTVLLVHGALSDHLPWGDNGDGFDFVAQLAAAGDYTLDAALDMVPSRFDWVTFRGSTQSQAHVLAARLQLWRTRGVQSVDVVAHSQGGLVSRFYLKHLDPQRDSGSYSIRRLIMLGTPNHGSEVANHIGLASLMMCLRYPVLCVPAAIALTADVRKDLSTGSRLLRDLNYDGGRAYDNDQCRPHQDETTLNVATQFVTYRGTSFSHPLPSGSCTEALINATFGPLLLRLTHNCTNDGLVPTVSVRLRHNLPQPNIINWDDADCGCNSSHLRDVCPEMINDFCVVAAVDRALRGDPMCSPPQGRGEPQQGGARFDVLLAESVVLAPGELNNTMVAAGTADSLVFRLQWLAGHPEFMLVEPGGRPVTPDTAAVDPDIDYLEEPEGAAYVVRSASPGDWTLTTDARASTDSVLAVLSATEYSDVGLQVDLGLPEIPPGGIQRIEATLAFQGAPILGAGAEARVVQPDGGAVAYALHDDGADGDLAANDGIYTGLVGGNQQTGAYDVRVHTTGSYGQGAVLRRDGVGFYAVEIRPDVELRPEDITLSHAHVDTQQVVTVTAAFRNLGGGPADSVRVEFLERTTQLTFGDTLLTAVPVGEEVMISREWMVRRIRGQYITEFSLGARVDVLGSPGEAVLDNNQGFVTVEVVGVADEDGGQAPARHLPLSSMNVRVRPNPFNPSTQVEVRLTQRGRARLSIYDAAGRFVALPFDQVAEPGDYLVIWNGISHDGHALSSGVYFYRLESGTRSLTGRMVLLK